MDTAQIQAVKLANKGHNLIITGSPGTGKTFVLKQIVDNLLIDHDHEEHNVKITATTGKAAFVIRNLLGKDLDISTIHKLCGLVDGRFSNEELLHNILHNEIYERQLTNLRETSVLIVDEISMLSSKLFEQIDYLYRKVKCIEKPFGGIHVILSGDFYQLPPVPNPEYGDDGNYILSSDVIRSFHHINLETIHRQEEPDLIKAIHEIARGDVTEETVHLMSRLKRTLPPPTGHTSTVKLFPTNFEVELFNAQSLLNIEGEDHVYRSQDSGEVQNISGVSELHLKIGCPVTLVVNLSDELVNGLNGKVINLNEESVDVNFPALGRTVKIKMFTFTKYSKAENKDVGCRKQIPLRLAFALTVHKSQGMTLDRVSVDCRHMFAYGQLTVGISRARTKLGLQVLNFSPKLFMKPPQIITDFYKLPSLQFREDKTCCRNACIEIHLLEDPVLPKPQTGTIGDADDDEDDADEEALINYIDAVETAIQPAEPKFPLPNTVDVNNVLERLLHSFEETPGQVLENNILRHLMGNLEETNKFVQYIWDEQCQLKQKHFPQHPKTKLDNKILTQFYRDCNKLYTSPEYQLHCNCVFTETLSPVHHNVFFKLSCSLRNEMLQIQAEPVREAAKQQSSQGDGTPGQSFTESEGGRGKIRYIAGWCLYATGKKLKKTIVNNMYKSDKRKIVEKAVLKKSLIDHLKTTSEEADATSMGEINRKQNVRCGLTVVSDECYNFFHTFDNKVRSLQTQESLNLYGSKFSEYLQTHLTNDQQLEAKWNRLFQTYANKDTDEDSIKISMKELLQVIITKYATMSVGQLRKEYMESLHMKKKEATRKQIKMRSDVRKKGIFKIQDIKSDSSVKKASSHKRLQSEILSDDKFLHTFCSKTDLYLICDAYGMKYNRSSNKKTLAEKLNPILMDSSSMPFSSVIDHINLPGPSHIEEPQSEGHTDQELHEDQEQATSSTPVTLSPPRAEIVDTSENIIRPSKKGKGVSKGKGKGKKRKVVQWACGICSKDAGFNSVGCDNCDTWYHADCLRIEDLDELPEEWFCQDCQENV